RQQVVWRERLHDIGESAGLGSPLDQLLLTECREEHDGRDVILAELLGGGDAVEKRHLHVHHDEIRTKLGREGHGGFAVSSLADDIEAVVSKSLDNVETDE